MNDFNIRDATVDDAKALLAIYAPVVEKTVVSFEVEVPTLATFIERINTISQKYCWLVATVNNQPVGYVYASSHRAREAYRYAVETAIYIHQNFQQAGIAKMLYQSLFNRLEKYPYYNAYAGITMPNEASIKLHQSLGFKSIGVFPDVGYKFGQWHSTSWWHRKIQSGSPVS